MVERPLGPLIARRGSASSMDSVPTSQGALLALGGARSLHPSPLARLSQQVSAEVMGSATPGRSLDAIVSREVDSVMRRSYLVLLAAAACCTLGDRLVSESDTQASSSQIQAMAALLVLRTAVAVAGDPQLARYVVLPNTDALDERQAAQALAAHRKPIECSSALADGSLVIDCRELLPVERVGIHSKIAEGLADFVRATIRAWGTSVSAEALVLMRTSAGSLVISIGDLDGFLTNYEIALGGWVDPPDEEARLKGAIAVYAVDATRSPPQLSSF